MPHLSKEEMLKKIEEASHLVEVGKKYYHYKKPDHFYLVEGLEIREETCEVSVRYKALYETGLVFNRTLDSWLQPAEVEGRKVPRFQKVN